MQAVAAKKIRPPANFMRSVARTAIAARTERRLARTAIAARTERRSGGNAGVFHWSALSFAGA